MRKGAGATEWSSFSRRFSFAERSEVCGMTALGTLRPSGIDPESVAASGAASIPTDAQTEASARKSQRRDEARAPIIMLNAGAGASEPVLSVTNDHCAYVMR